MTDTPKKPEEKVSEKGNGASDKAKKTVSLPLKDALDAVRKHSETGEGDEEEA